MGKKKPESAETEACLYVKAHRAGGMLTVAACDRDCMGKTYEEGNLCLDLKKHGNFYKGELCTREQAAEKIKKADSINLVGKDAVALGTELGLVKKTLEIAGVPHAQAYLIS